MKSTALKDVLHRAEKWTAEDQEELVQAALYIEKRQSAEFKLDGDDWAIIEARLEAARLGDVATEAEVESMFSKYRAA